MEKEIELYRILAEERYKSGESPETICATLVTSLGPGYISGSDDIMSMTSHGTGVNRAALIQSIFVHHYRLKKSSK